MQLAVGGRKLDDKRLRLTLHRDFPAHNPTGMTMRIGILFPVVIFIVAVAFLIWFFVGGYAAPGGIK